MAHTTQTASSLVAEQLLSAQQEVLELVARAARKARLHGKSVTDVVTESLEAYVTRSPLLGCCTHLAAKGSAMPVGKPSIPTEEWGSLAR